MCSTMNNYKNMYPTLQPKWIKVCLDIFVLHVILFLDIKVCHRTFLFCVNCYT